MHNSTTVTAEKAFWRNLFHINNTVVKITINGEKTSILVPKVKIRLKTSLFNRQVQSINDINTIANSVAIDDRNIDAACKILSSIKDSSQKKRFIDNITKQTNKMGQNIGINFAAKVVCAYLEQCSNDIQQQFIQNVMVDLKNGYKNDYQLYTDLTAILVKAGKYATIADIINCTSDNESNTKHFNIRWAISRELIVCGDKEMEIIVNNVNIPTVNSADDNKASSNMDDECRVKVDKPKKIDRKHQISDIRKKTMDAISQMDAGEFAELINLGTISPENAIHVLTNHSYQHKHDAFFNLLVNSIKDETIKQQVASGIGVDLKQQSSN